MEQWEYAKEIAKKFPKELGFVNKTWLKAQYDKRELIVMPDVGYVSFHHRKDDQTTIYEIASKYGSTDVPLSFFQNEFVHALGGSPDKQAILAKKLNLVSLDGNYAMKTASFGKSVWVGNSSGEKVYKGCYESFKYSMNYPAS